MKKTYVSCSQLSVCALSLFAFLIAANSIAGVAKGKPFVALAGQIVEVQGAVVTLEDQMADLIGQVDSIEGRLSANEQAIAELTIESAQLSALISGAYTSIEEINTEIVALSLNMAENSDLIASLQAALVSVEEGQIDLASNLQDQIDDNLALLDMLEGNVEAINDYLAADQHITEGTCAAGEYVIGHTQNSVSCAPVVGGGSSSLLSYFTYARSVSWGKNIQVYCHLPTDMATGGGFNAIQTNHSVRRSTPTGVNGWTVELVGNERDVQAYVMCLRSL